MNRTKLIPTNIVCNTGSFPAVYKRLDSIGSGGFGKVFKVIDTKTNVIYALKVVPNDRLTSDVERQLLENEINHQKVCNHPNIVQVINTFSDSLNQYIVMEYCQGGSIEEKYKKNGRFNDAEITEFINSALEAIQYIHNKGIIHRDIKLGNFLIGDNNIIKLCDFGLSVSVDKAADYAVSGTPSYLSPELLIGGQNSISQASDIWALGVCAFILLNGYSPFEASTQPMMYERIKNGSYRFNSAATISIFARDFITKALTKDPKDRPTARDLIRRPLSSRKLTRSLTTPSISVMPQCGVSRFWDLSDKYGFSYLFQDGSVGAIFKDQSMMITDPHQTFVQYYQTPSSQNFELVSAAISNDEICGKISRLSKFGDTLRNAPDMFCVPITRNNPSKPLTYLKGYYRDGATILFQYNNGDLQVNFEDGMKLFFFAKEQRIIVSGGLRICGKIVKLAEMDKPDNKDEAERYEIAMNMLKNINPRRLTA
jgi:polo-like kinase 1